MKSFLKTLVVSAFLFSAVQASAVEFITVKPGDTLSKIGKKIGFTPVQIAGMNDIWKYPTSIQPGDQIRVGQKLKYFAQKDIDAAKRWCDRRMSELPPSSEDYHFFQYAKMDLEQRHFRYTLMERSGLHGSLVIEYSEAWRRYGNK